MKWTKHTNPIIRLATAATLSAASFGAAAAPFCVVSSMGTNCSFMDYGYCWQAARNLGGACVANAQQQAAPSGGYVVGGMVTPSPANAFLDGERRALEAQKQRAEIDLLRAEREQIEQQTRPSQVLYRCGDIFTTKPREGCVVDSTIPAP